MTVIDGFTRRCLRVAARRWPAHLRDERFREWTAEMHMISSDSSVSAGQRAWEQLRYAFSLAASPPAPDENRVPRGWRELLPRAGRRLRPWALLMAVGMACPVLAGPVHGLVPGLISTLTGGYPNGVRPMAATIMSTLVLIGGTGLVAWLGAVIGRRMPLLPDPGGRVARVVSVAGAPLAVGAGMLAVEAGRLEQYLDPDVMIAKSGLYGPLLWMILFAPAALIAVWAVRRGRSGIGRTLGIATGLLALELLTIPLTFLGAASMPVGPLPVADAAWWFPMSIVDDPARADFLAVTGVAQVVPTLLVASGCPPPRTAADRCHRARRVR